MNLYTNPVSKSVSINLEINDAKKENIEYRILKYLQEGISFESRPYVSISNRLGITDSIVVEVLKKAKQENKIRKVGASVNHRLLGYSYNCMLVLNIEPKQLYFVVEFICQFLEVSHCYERKRVFNQKINWPYNLFAVIHGKTKKECESIIEKIIKYGCIEDYLSIYSTKELKKTGVRL